MSKRSKSKRFFKQGADSIKRFEERIPYYSTLEEAESKKEQERNEMREF